MGCSPFYCCFKNYRPNCIALTALVANIIAVAFMIWGLVDLEWDLTRRGRKALYIIAFVILCVTLVLMFVVLLLLNLRSGPNYITCNNIGRIFCLIIIILAILIFSSIYVVFFVLYMASTHTIKFKKISKSDYKEGRNG